MTHAVVPVSPLPLLDIANIKAKVSDLSAFYQSYFMYKLHR